MNYNKHIQCTYFWVQTCLFYISKPPTMPPPTMASTYHGPSPTTALTYHGPHLPWPTYHGPPTKFVVKAHDHADTWFEKSPLREYSSKRNGLSYQSHEKSITVTYFGIDSSYGLYSPCLTHSYTLHINLS